MGVASRLRSPSYGGQVASSILRTGLDSVPHLRETSPFERVPDVIRTAARLTWTRRGRTFIPDTRTRVRPSTTHAPEPVAWQPGPQPSAALAAETANSSIRGNYGDSTGGTILSAGFDLLIGINPVCSRRPTLAKLPSNGGVWLCRGAFAVTSGSRS